MTYGDVERRIIRILLIQGIPLVCQGDKFIEHL